MIKLGLYIKVYNKNREGFCPDGINIVCGERHNGRFTLCDNIGDRIKVLSYTPNNSKWVVIFDGAKRTFNGINSNYWNTHYKFVDEEEEVII